NCITVCLIVSNNADFTHTNLARARSGNTHWATLKPGGRATPSPGVSAQRKLVPLQGRARFRPLVPGAQPHAATLLSQECLWRIVYPPDNGGAPPCPSRSFHFSREQCNRF